MKLIKKITLHLSLIGVVLVGIFGFVFTPVYAENAVTGVAVSPMKEKIILTPGETYYGSFVVANPAKYNTDFNYKVTLSPFFATDDYNITYENTGDYNQIVNWITIDTTSGTLKPNDTNEIKFKIDVPKNAPAGGQYAAIVIGSADNDSESGATEGMGVQINQGMGVAHTIFAEVTGTTIRSGKIISTDLPGFMLSGKITASATIENTGNVHGDAIYKLQIFPLFSGEEVYTNEENPDTSIILPNRTRYHETVWNETPIAGIFNVKYTVEFEGVTTEVTKLVIICPLWLLFLILFAVAALIIWIIIRIRMRKRTVEESEAE